MPNGSVPGVGTVTTAFSCPVQQLLPALASRAPAIWRIRVAASCVESIAPSAYRMFTATLQLQKAHFQ